MSKRICLLHRYSGQINTWDEISTFDLGEFEAQAYGHGDDKAFFSISNWDPGPLDLHLINPCYHRSVVIINEGNASFRITTFNSQGDSQVESNLLRGNGGVLKVRTLYDPATGLWDVRVNFY